MRRATRGNMAISAALTAGNAPTRQHDNTNKTGLRLSQTPGSYGHTSDPIKRPTSGRVGRKADRENSHGAPKTNTRKNIDGNQTKENHVSQPR
jgi:hypothetical protein